MADVNVVILAGRLTRDPEHRTTPNGSSVAKFGLAIGRKFKGKDGNVQEETTFVDVDAWGKQAAAIAQYCKKGSPVLVQGSLRTESWEDKATGQKRSKLLVSADRVQFLGTKPSGDEKKTAAPKAAEGDDLKIDEEDIPF